MVGRICPGTDLVPGILAMCAQAGICYGYVASLIGSLAGVRFIYVRRDPAAALGASYVDPVERVGPFELLGAQGTLGTNGDGSAVLHLHALFCDQDNHVFGGHVLDSGNPVLATVEVAVRETQGVRMVRGPDEETGFSLFSILGGH